LAGLLLLGALAAPIGIGVAHAVRLQPSDPAQRSVVHSVGRVVSHDPPLMLTPRQWKADQQGPTMDAMLPPDGLAMKLPPVVWLLALEVLGILLFPLSFLMFGGLADRGWVVSKTLGPIVLAYLVWVGAATGIAQFDRVEILVALLLLAAIAVVTAASIRGELMNFIADDWKKFLAPEAVFLAGFVLFLCLRAWYPDLGHQFAPVSPINPGDGRMGEKQMEMAFLNGIVRSRVFPPLDPFFAHGYINYYYFGFVIVATLCKLTQITTATGFNLAIASFFAMLVGNVFSVAQTLTRRVWPGLVAAGFVGIIGNLAGAWQVIQNLMSVAAVHSSIPLLGGFLDVISGVRAVLVDHAQLAPFSFWDPTRIVPPVGLDITEFPYFTYLFADLHPHLMAYPMTAVALAFACSLAVSSFSGAARRAVALALGAILFGAILATNPWDFPTYIVVVGIGALVGAYAESRRLEPALLLRPAAWCVGLAAVGYVLFYPFEHSYRTVFNTGIGFTRDLVVPVCGKASTCQGTAYDTLVTPLGTYLEHFGLFVFIALSFVVLLLARSDAAVGARRWVTRAQFVYYYRDRLGRVRRAARVARRVYGPRPRGRDPSLDIAVVLIVAGLFLVHLNLLAFLAAVLGLTFIVLWHSREQLSATHLFVLALSLVPLGLSFLTQIGYVKDFLAGGNAFRMNTIFKFYNQAWLLFAVIAAVALWSIVTWLMPVPTPAPPAGEENKAAPTPVMQEARLSRAVHFVDRHWLWSLCLTALLAGSLVYTYAGTVSREMYRTTWLPESSVPFTLDGMAFMKVAYPGDYAGISWLNAHVGGAPVIAEADSGYYQWPSRVSMFTGLPDIINGNHETDGEQRFSSELGSRSSDLATLYDSPDPQTAWRIIHTYRVRYIFVGWLEQHCTHQGGDANAPTTICYSHSGIAKFRSMVGHGLQIAFNRPGITIYRVVGA
jgi:YYY domain-containing protein